MTNRQRFYQISGELAALARTAVFRLSLFKDCR